jgi:endonuclease/exonuclease/phosphatase family metal-dependent hydrolase
MSFNLRICRFIDFQNAWPFRKLKVAEVIQTHNPWIVGTQEGSKGMLRDLDPHLKEYGRVGEGRNGDDNGEYNAIYYHLKRLQLLESGQFWLSDTPDRPGSKGWDARFPRICTWARFRLAKEPGRQIAVYNTHLDHLGEMARVEGTLLIWDTIQEHRRRFSPVPVLLIGDFNAGPSDPVIRFLSGDQELRGRKGDLANAFADPLHAGRTHHGFQGGKAGGPIDYLFGGYGLQPLHGDVIRSKIGGRYPSDHYPVAAMFRLQPLAH